VTGRLLLDAAADVVDDGAGELDDVEGVEHGDGVLERVVDGVLVAVEGVEGGDLDARAEGLTALDEPGPVGLPGAAGDQVEQAGMDVSVLVTGEVHHSGELLRAAAAVLDRLCADAVPDVLVDAEHLDAAEAGGVGVRGSEQRSDRFPDRAPAGAELPAEAVDGGVLAAQLVDGPPAGAGRELGPRRRDAFVLLDERGHRTRGLGAEPAPLAPADPHRATHRRRVDQVDVEAAVPERAAGTRQVTSRPQSTAKSPINEIAMADTENDAGDTRWPAFSDPREYEGPPRSPT
jgi:hypothetical protein